MSAADAYEFECVDGDPGFIANQAAADCFRNRDGFELSWPLVLVVDFCNGTQKTFNVDCEMVPQFAANELNYTKVHCDSHKGFEYDCIDCMDVLVEARGY